MPPRLGTIAVDGGELGYVVQGDGSPTVLFVPGGLTTGELWSEEARRLSEGRRTVRYDLRGTGRSPSASGRFRYDRDLAALIRALGGGPVDLVATSLGAAIALDLAVEEPSLVRGLVLVAPALGGYEPTVPEARPMAVRMLRPVEEAEMVGDEEGAVRALLEAWLAGPYRALPDLPGPVRERAERLFEDGRRSTPAASLVAEPPERPARDRLRRLRAPTLVVAGALDLPGVRATAEHIAEELPNGRYLRVDGAAHLPMLERPDELHRALVGFLDALP